MSKSVCVIGAGVGGLMAGALLAKKGWRVTVLEKATTVGGSAGWYVRNGHTFPTGATIAFGLEERGLLKTLLDELELDLDFDLIHYPMDVILSDRKVAIYQNPQRWEEELTRAFPERSSDVLAFWRKLEQLSKHVYGVTASGASLPIQKVYDVGKLPRYAVAHSIGMLQLAMAMNSTVEDLLRKYRLDTYEPFRQFVDAQLMDAAQTDCAKAALLPASLALTIYRRGSYYIEKGMGRLSEALAERIVALGGEVRVASSVKELVYEDTKWHVTSKRRTESFDVVINNAGVSFGPETSYAEDDEFSWGAFRIDAILHATFWNDVLDSRPLPFAAQIMPREVLSGGHGPVYVTFQPAFDSANERLDEEIMMTISIHADVDEWGQYSKEVYKEKKQHLMDAMMAEIQKVYPVTEHMVYAEAGTPKTYAKYIGKSGVGGFPLTVKNAILRPRSVRSKLPQLYIVGEQAFPGPGTLSSALSGYYAARAIEKEM